MLLTCLRPRARTMLLDSNSPTMYCPLTLFESKGTELSPISSPLWKEGFSVVSGSLFLCECSEVVLSEGRGTTS